MDRIKAKEWLITIFPRNYLTLLSDENTRYMVKKNCIIELRKNLIPRKNFATRNLLISYIFLHQIRLEVDEATKWSEENENLAVTRAPTLFSNQRFVRVAITVLLTLFKLICFILLPGIRPSVRTLADHRTKFSRAIRVPVCTLLPHKNRYAVKGFSESRCIVIFTSSLLFLPFSSWFYIDSNISIPVKSQILLLLKLIKIYRL